MPFFKGELWCQRSEIKEMMTNRKKGNKCRRDSSIKTSPSTTLPIHYTGFIAALVSSRPPLPFALSLPLSRSLSAALPPLPSPPVDGVALSLLLSLPRSLVEPHTRIRGLLWVSAQREEARRQKEIKTKKRKKKKKQEKQISRKG